MDEVQIEPRRESYTNIVGATAIIAKDFGIEVDGEKKGEIYTIVRASEIIDRFYDAIKDDEKRRAFGERILTALRSGATEGLEGMEELSGSLAQLNSLFGRYPERKIDFIRKVEEILSKSEIIRVAANVHECINEIVREGELAAELYTLLIEGQTERFRAYVRKVGAAANIIDDMRDAEADIASGERNYALDRAFYATMLKEALFRVVELITLYPLKVKALRLSAKVLNLSRTAQRTIPERRPKGSLPSNQTAG